MGLQAPPSNLAKAVTRFIPKGPMGRGILTLAGGTALAQLAVAASMPVVTRLYSPAEIGVIALFMAFFGFWSSISSWRYESAILVAASLPEAHSVFWLGSLVVVLMSMVSGGVLFFLVTARLAGFGLLPVWSAWAAIPIHLGFGLFMIHRAWALRNGLVLEISKGTVGRAISNAVVRMALGVTGFGVIGLFAAEFAGAWSAYGILRHALGRTSHPAPPVGLTASVFGAARRFSKFPKYEMPSVGLDQLAIMAPVPIIASVYGAEAAGWFGLSRILVSLPNAQIGRAVADVFQMEVARAVREGDYASAGRLFFRLLRKLSLYGLVPMVGLALLSPLAVPWVFGTQWAETGLIAALMTPWLYAALVVGSLSRVVSVIERQEYKLVYDFSTLLLLFGAFICIRRFDLSLISAVGVLTFANVLGYAIYLSVLLHVVSKYLKPKN